MDATTNTPDMKQALAERFSSLPKVVQEAITSADVQKHLRDLAEVHKLHVDQWQVLENNVMLSLLGFQPVADLAQHLQKDLGVTEEVGVELAASISEIVFSPIRGEMERALEHPAAAAETVSDVEAARAQEMGAAAGDTPVPAPAAGVTPATPPAPAPEEKAVRAQVAQTYAGTASHERKSIEGDPYREQLI